jgi:hypothetical protein
VSSESRSSSRFHKIVLMIMCPLSPYLRPSLMRRCLLSSGGFLRVSQDGDHNSPRQPLYYPGSTSGCSTPAVSLVPVMPTWPLYPLGALLAVISSISTSCTLQMHPHQVGIAPVSTKCTSVFRVYVFSECTSLLEVHFSSSSVLLFWGGEKKKISPSRPFV